MEIALRLDNDSVYRGKKLKKYQSAGEFSNGQIIENLKNNGVHEFQRIYIGNDFCENMFLSIDELRTWQKICLDAGLHLTIMTPLVSQSGLKSILQIISFIKNMDRRLEIEIVVNDVGIMQLLRNDDIRISCGRLFDKSPCDARFQEKDYLVYFAKNGLNLLNKSAICSRGMDSILKKYNVKRIEFDSCKSIDFNKNYKYTFYVPYSYITMGRMCMFKNYKNHHLFDISYGNCKKICKDVIQIMEKSNSIVNSEGIIQKNRVTLLRKGNAVLAKNAFDIKKIPIEIDRLLIENI
ncbi:hypothetical protein D7X87_26810 [bacterium D16-54]|nr:hypothetical protein D7X87_26810 [bacterium D16-54]RKJ08247.1 hypothetical protein D7X65_26790 [bacterium D16-56]